jgi:two-component sensor histidine kinase
MAAGSNTAGKLAAENWRLTAELAEARDILRALRNGEVDALVGAEYDSIYVIQLIALAVDKAETYVDSLALLMSKLCDATRSDYCEAWAVTPNRRSIQRTPVWCGSGGDAFRMQELVNAPETDPPAVLLDTFRTKKAQPLAVEHMRGAYAERIRQCGLQSGLALPLVVDDRVLAVLTLWTQERRERDEAVIDRSRRILGESGRFVQRKLEQEGRQEMLQALRGVVRDRSRRLVELSVELDSKSRERDEAEQRSYASEEALQQQTAMLQAVLDGMMDGVIVTDPAGRAVQFNPAAGRLLGKDPSDTPLERWPDFYGLYRAQYGTPLRASEMPLAKALLGDRTERMEIFVRNEACPEGRILEISASPVRDAETARSYGAVALLHDVTEQRRGESSRRRSMIEQRDAVVRQVHHNVKNSLAGIMELVQQHAREHPEIKPLVQNVEAQLSAIATVHGIEALGGNGIQFGSLVHSLRDNVQSLFGARVKMDNGNDDVWRLRLQESESVPLALALNELMVNACKHGREGTFELAVAREGGDLVIRIANSAGRNARPPRSPAAGGNGRGLGIALVQSLLPHDMAQLHYQQSDGRVEAVLRLAPGVFQPPA